MVHNTYRHYKKHVGSEHGARPKHYLETKTFKVFPMEPEEVNTIGRYKFMFTRSLPSHKNAAYYYQRNPYWEVQTFISIDGEPFRPFQLPYRYSATKDTGFVGKMHRELLEERSKFQKERQRQLAKVRREHIKTQAEKRGISFDEMKAIDKAERIDVKNSRATKADVERTKRLLIVGPALRELKDEIDSVLAQLEKDPKKVTITYPKRVKRRIEEVVKIIGGWNRA